MSRKEKNDGYHHNHIFLVLLFLVLVSCVITTDTSLLDKDNSQDINRYQVSEGFRRKLEESKIPLEDFLPKDCNLIEPISTFNISYKPDLENTKEEKKRNIYYDKNRMLIRVGSRSAACPYLHSKLGINNDSLFIVSRSSIFINLILTFNYMDEYTILERNQINTIKTYGYSSSDTLTYSLDTIPEVEDISTIIDSLRQNSSYN